jgi:hypothetical protein
MAEASQITFSYKEVAEALVKKHGLHEGTWGLFVKFGLAASNIGPNDTDLKPAAMLAVMELGLQRFDKENNLTVDAAKVNPKPRAQPIYRSSRHS